MIHSMAIKITNNLIHNQIAKYENKEIYIYGLEKLLGKTISYVMLLILGISLDLLIPIILFSIFFLSLRGRTGGYHASSQLSCFISSIAMYLLCIFILVPFFISFKFFLFFLLVVSSIYILISAPVNHPNLDLDKNEIMVCKRSCRYILLLEWIVLISIYFLKINTVCIIFPSLGIIMCSVLIFISKLIKQEVIKNEEI